VVTLLEKRRSNRKLSSLASLNLGIAFAATARLEDAATVLRDGLAADQDSLPIADELAMVLMLLGRVEEAYAVFDGALARHPDDKRTQVLYLSTLVTSNSEKAPGYAKKLLTTYPLDWEVLYFNAVVASREGDFLNARELVEKSVSLNPGNSQAQHLLGSSLAKLGDYAGAKEHLQRAIQAGDNQPEVHYELSKVMQRLGDSQGAADELQAYQSIKNVQSGKTQAAGKAEVADQEIRAGNAAKAAVLYREAIESDPDESLLHYKLSKALDQINDIEEEKKELQRAITLNPDLPEAQNQMGYLIAREGNTQAAESYLRAAVRASPSYVPAWINLAATLASESKWQAADDAIEHALSVDPGNAQAKQLREAIATARPNP
jgi:tetratricopeptide (TPR) repeat protein